MRATRAQHRWDTEKENRESQGARALTRGEKKGVFATRTPHRPVPIGLSLVELRSIEFDGGYLEVVGADLVDGTPILDMKPYIPFSDARHPVLQPGLFRVG